MRCECEHEAHFGHDPTGHVYSLASPTLHIDTAWGGYEICRDCHEADHMTGAEAYLEEATRRAAAILNGEEDSL